MSKKFSASRKRAFLTYLAQTANQTLSAERAKVSRSWVCLHRAQDAAFDAACREAIAVAAERLGRCEASHAPHPAQPAAESPSPLQGRGAKLTYHGGVELVVAGSNKRCRQVRRARVRQWSPAAEARFLAALSATCNVKAACAEVGLWPPSAYNHRKRWPGFAARWDEAIAQGYAEIEAALIRSACAHLSGEDDPFEPANLDLRVVEMSAAHALAALNTYRKLVPVERYGPAVREAYAAEDRAVRERIERKMEALLRDDG